jgi:hypothetical protein
MYIAEIKTYGQTTGFNNITTILELSFLPIRWSDQQFLTQQKKRIDS